MAWDNRLGTNAVPERTLQSTSPRWISKIMNGLHSATPLAKSKSYQSMMEIKCNVGGPLFVTTEVKTRGGSMDQGIPGVSDTDTVASFVKHCVYTNIEDVR